jgi:SMODS and SLOG-associating 2TM effector domain family 5
LPARRILLLLKRNPIIEDAMLSDRIWITKKTRIYSEKRFENNKLISQILLTYYSLVLVFFSVWNLLANDQQLNLILVFSSISLLVVSIFLSSQRYTERSIAMHNCYIKLDEIYSKLTRAEKGNEMDKIIQLETEYSGILLNIENHLEFDYLTFRFSQRNNSETTLPKFERMDYFSYYFGILWRLGFTLLNLLIPFIMYFVLGCIL